MRAFEEIAPDAGQLRLELDELDAFLSKKKNLEERKHVAPLFKKRRQLIAALGLANSEVQFVNRVAVELDLFGDFSCDVACGDSEANAFTLIEFEAAKTFSIFTRRDTRGVRRWSPVYERGFSQLVDWVWRLESDGQSAALRRIFGKNSPHLHLLLVIGRRSDLTDDDYDRLRWRSRNVTISNYKVTCWTFDDVLATVRRRLAYIEGRNLAQAPCGRR